MASFKKYTGANGKVVWYVIWKAPYRQEDGALEYRRTERSTGCSDRKLAEKQAKLFQNEAIVKANIQPAPKREQTTFAEAALAYAQNGKSCRFLPRLIEEIGNKRLVDIDQSLAQDLCRKFHPDSPPSTLNRTIFTPIMAVVNFDAAMKKLPPFKLQRPKGHNKLTPRKSPKQDWFAKVLPLLPPESRAALMILTLHGRRVSEITKRTPADIVDDGEKWELHIPDSKTGVPVRLALCQPVIDAIREIPDWKDRKWLFGSPHANVLRNRMKAACEKAGVEYFSTHPAGRITFGRELLRARCSLGDVKRGGGWKSMQVVIDQYGYLEQDEIDDTVARIATARAAKYKVEKTGGMK